MKCDLTSNVYRDTTTHSFSLVSSSTISPSPQAVVELCEPEIVLRLPGQPYVSSCELSVCAEAPRERVARGTRAFCDDVKALRGCLSALRGRRSGEARVVAPFNGVDSSSSSEEGEAYGWSECLVDAPSATWTEDGCGMCASWELKVATREKQSLMHLRGMLRATFHDTPQSKDAPQIHKVAALELCFDTRAFEQQLRDAGTSSVDATCETTLAAIKLRQQRAAHAELHDISQIFGVLQDALS